MKKTDIAMIILIASASVLVSYFVVSALPFFANGEQVENVKVAEPISSTVEKPDTSVFNSDAINPTVEVIIGDNQDASSQVDASQPEVSVDDQLPESTDGTQ